jgi:hypothetical protein
MARFTIAVDPSPDQSDIRILIEGLEGHAFAQVGATPPQPLAVFLYDDTGKIVGGVSGRVWDGIMDISRSSGSTRTTGAKATVGS